MTTKPPNVPAGKHDHIERQEMATWKDTPTRKIDVERRRVRIPRTRHRLRRSGGVPAPPDRGPRRLGPADHRRYRRAPSRDRLRQPRYRRDGLIGPTHGRADGRRRHRLHPRTGPRARRPIRVLARRRRRPDGRLTGTRTRTTHDPRRHRSPRRRRHRQDGDDRRRAPTSKRHSRSAIPGTSCSFPAPPRANAPRRTTSTASRSAPRTGTNESPCRPASLSSRPSGTPG